MFSRPPLGIVQPPNRLALKAVTRRVALPFSLVGPTDQPREERKNERTNEHPNSEERTATGNTIQAVECGVWSVELWSVVETYQRLL